MLYQRAILTLDSGAIFLRFLALVLSCEQDGSTRRASQTPSVSFEQGVP